MARTFASNNACAVCLLLRSTGRTRRGLDGAVNVQRAMLAVAARWANRMASPYPADGIQLQPYEGSGYTFS